MKKVLYSQQFGSVIRRLRLEKNLSQTSVGERADLERNYISMLETGFRHPSLDMTIRIALALDMTPGELVDLVMKESSKSPQ